MLRVRNPQDFGAGILFIVLGFAGLYFGKDLLFGSARSMGPGYFPSIISALIALIGLIVALRSLSVSGPEVEPFQLRPILMLMISIGVFAFAIASLGMIISSILLVVIASYAQRKVNLVEVLVFAVVMSVFVVLIFVYGLNQPMPIWWSF